MPTRRSEPADALSAYRRKRDFERTPEPRATAAKRTKQRSFVIQKHAASRLHYDFRLELDGVLLSWAVPKGPSFDPADKRMAIHVEDHPLSYGSFEGTIPPKQYGAGTVIVWDRGTWEPVGDPRAGPGRRASWSSSCTARSWPGLWELVKIAKAGEKQEPWILFKKRDEFARPKADYDVVTRAARQRDRQAAAGRSAEREASRPCRRGVAAARRRRRWSARRAPGAVKAPLPASCRRSSRRSPTGRADRRRLALRDQVRRLPPHGAHRERQGRG